MQYGVSQTEGEKATNAKQVDEKKEHGWQDFSTGAKK